MQCQNSGLTTTSTYSIPSRHTVTRPPKYQVVNFSLSHTCRNGLKGFSSSVLQLTHRSTLLDGKKTTLMKASPNQMSKSAAALDVVFIGSPWFTICKRFPCSNTLPIRSTKCSSTPPPLGLQHRRQIPVYEQPHQPNSWALTTSAKQWSDEECHKPNHQTDAQP